MTEEEELKTEWEPPPEAPPHVNVNLVAALGAGALMVFAFAVLATWVVMRDEQVKINPGGGSVPARLGEADINLIKQAPFVLETRAYAQKEHEAQVLESYGWTAPDAGEIHVPIERAMAHVIAEQQHPDGGVPWGP